MCNWCQARKVSFDRLRAVHVHNGHARDRVTQAKADRGPLDEMGRELAELAGGLGWRIDAVVPVPLSAGGRQRRGYNQAEVLARHVSRALDAPVRLDVLRRGVDTMPQRHQRSVRGRVKNVRGAFSVHRHQDLTGWRVCLVDDTATTGQTMAEAAATLKAAGAEHVAALAYTRTQDVSGGGELVDEALGVKEIAEAMALYGFEAALPVEGERVLVIEGESVSAWHGTRHRHRAFIRRFAPRLAPLEGRPVVSVRPAVWFAEDRDLALCASISWQLVEHENTDPVHLYEVTLTPPKMAAVWDSTSAQQMHEAAGTGAQVLHLLDQGEYVVFDPDVVTSARVFDVYYDAVGDRDDFDCRSVRTELAISHPDIVP